MITGSTPLPIQLLLNGLEKAVRHGSSGWVPATREGDLEDAPLSWLLHKNQELWTQALDPVLAIGTVSPFESPQLPVTVSFKYMNKSFFKENIALG